MKVEKRDSTHERRVLIGLIVDRVVLASVTARWDGELFRSKWANLIAGWCVKFFRSYERAPGREVEHLFQGWAERSRDKDTVALVEKFLVSLSDEYEELGKESNSQFVIDLAGRYFNDVKALRLAEAIQEDLEEGRGDEAQRRLEKHNRVELGTGTGVNIFKDKEAIDAIFAARNEPLIRYPGALGVFFEDALERDGFVAFMGPEKRGKSFCLLDVVWRSIEQNRNVAYFVVGDMSQNQVMRRMLARACRRPLKPGKVKYPTYLVHNASEKYAEVDHKVYQFKHFMSPTKAWKTMLEISRRIGGADYLKLSCHPGGTISVLGIQSTLQAWGRLGWTPDVVVVDYADVLAPCSDQRESRLAINETWARLRTLSQTFHCLVVTATQADAASYEAKLLSMSNFSESKLKFAHVTGMVGLNCDDNHEKPYGLMRLNWLVLRESDFVIEKCVHVAGSRSIANPFIKSTF